MCLCDNIGLVALLLLGWELRASSITVLCVQAVMILSPLLFMPSLYSHSNSKNFYITCTTKSITRNKQFRKGIEGLYKMQKGHDWDHKAYHNAPSTCAVEGDMHIIQHLVHYVITNFVFYTIPTFPF